MEFLDPKYQRRHLIQLIIGYILVGIALILTTTVLLYRAYGYGITKEGEVIQNGLVFVSSRPEGAAIYIDGKKQQEQTNDRILMAAGQYTFEIQREGYRPWKRAIAVEGGSVMRYDYPALFPAKLTTTTVAKYDVQPPLATESPDRRWLAVQRPNGVASFDVFDLRNPKDPAETVTLPADIITLNSGLQRWSLVEWSTDNRHVVLLHTSQENNVTKSEYLLLDRETPQESINLTTALQLGSQTLELRDKKFDKYYLYDAARQTVSSASIDEPTPKVLLEKVSAFKSHGEDRMLYVTTQGAAKDKVAIKLREGDNTYTVRQVAPADTYVLNIASYERAWYIVAGSPAENRTYVYKNPAANLRAKPQTALVPVQVLKVANANKVSFSDNARFIMAENSQQIAVYDAENDRGYAYELKAPLDSPQEHVTWMDGHRMMAVIGGKVMVFDFDNANSEVLTAASPAYIPFFDRDYEFMYTLAPQAVKADDGTASTQYILSSTALRTPEDL